MHHTLVDQAGNLAFIVDMTIKCFMSTDHMIGAALVNEIIDTGNGNNGIKTSLNVRTCRDKKTQFLSTCTCNIYMATFVKNLNDFKVIVDKTIIGLVHNHGTTVCIDLSITVNQACVRSTTKGENFTNSTTFPLVLSSVF
jgi:hypothetical protein